MQIYRIVFCFRIKKGLEVELVLDQRGYMSGTLSQKAGMRIAVHSPHLHPLVDEFGLDVEPGTASSIAIQLVNFDLKKLMKEKVKISQHDSRMTSRDSRTRTRPTATKTGTKRAWTSP